MQFNPQFKEIKVQTFFQYNLISLAIEYTAKSSNRPPAFYQFSSKRKMT